MNESLAQGTVPDDWRQAIVAPVFKKGEKYNAANYRPMSLTCRNLYNCPKSCRKNAYLALVRSKLEYGCIIWDPYLKNEIEQLENIQRSAA